MHADPERRPYTLFLKGTVIAQGSGDFIHRLAHNINQALPWENGPEGAATKEPAEVVKGWCCICQSTDCKESP